MNAPEVDAAALRRLARGLLFDADAAADVVQEAWLAALRSGREPTQSWLAGAVKRIALGTRRQARRRLEREQLSARPEARPGDAETAERLEVLRELVAALQRLDEPYRGAVVMRYLDDLPPREIARRTGVPVGTARAHVSRGLERLRRDIDGPQGRGREALLGVLGPWLARDAAVWTASTSPWIWLGGLAMKKLLATVLVVLGIAIGWSLLRDPAAPAAGPAAKSSAAAPIGIGTPDAAPAEIDLAETDLPSDRVAVAARAEYVVLGAILRAYSTPIPGAHVRLRVLRGIGLDGEVLLDQRLQADALGAFRHAFEPFAETTTLALEQDEPAHYGHPMWMTIAIGDEPWGPWGVGAYPLDVELLGQIVDSAGRGIVGARIIDSVYLREREVQSDADGNFRMRYSSASEAGRLVVRAEGHAEELLNFAVPSEGSLKLAPVTLRPELRFAGRVVDSDGRAVSGAEVIDRRSREHRIQRTDDAGRFVIGGIAPERDSVPLRVRHTQFMAFEQKVGISSEELLVQLSRGATLAGRVVSASGAAITNAYVRLGSDTGPGDLPGIVTGPDGSFELEHVAPGPASVWLWARGFANRRFRIEMPSDGSPCEDAVIVLEPEQVLRGRLLQSDGEPQPWGTLYVEDGSRRFGEHRFDSAQGRSDADGHFEVMGIPAGRVTVNAYEAGFAPLRVDLENDGAREVELKLQRAAGLCGRVIDAATGEPVRTFRVRVNLTRGPQGESGRLNLGNEWSSPGVEFNDGDGLWCVREDLEPGAWVSVDVDAEGYAAAHVERVQLAVDFQPEDCVVALARGTRLVGQVLDADGHPLAGATVHLPKTDGEASGVIAGYATPPNVATDASGRFEFLDVPTGPTSLVVEAALHAPVVDGPFEVLGGTSERTIQLRRGARVHGRLLDLEGAPLGGETVSLGVMMGIARARDYECTTDSDGRFEFANLAAGVHHLRWKRQRDEKTAFDLLRLVEIEDSQDLEFDLRPAGTASVSGALDFDGEIPELVVVRSLRGPVPGEPDAPGRYARSGRAVFAEHGDFLIEGLEPGRHSLTAQFELGNGSQAVGRVDVDVAEHSATVVRIDMTVFE